MAVRRKAILLGLVPSLVVLHFLFHVGFSIRYGAPDLLTVALLLAARELGMGTGAALGFAFGLLEDSFSALSFGASTVALTLLGALGARTRDLFVGDSLLFLFSYLALGKLARDLVTWFLVAPGVREGFFDVVVLHGTVAAVYGAAVGLLLLVPFGVSEVPR